LTPQLVSDEEVAAARARIANRSGLGRSDAFPSTSRIGTALAQNSGTDDGTDEDGDTLLEGSALRSQVAPPRGPSTAELSLTAERLHARLDPVSAVTKVLEEVDASRHELARLESEHQHVNQLLRAAVTNENSGNLDPSLDSAVTKLEQSTRLDIRGDEPPQSTSRRKAAARRPNLGPNFAARRRLAAGGSEWSSDSDSDDDTAKRQQEHGDRVRHDTTGPLGSYPGRARQRSMSSDPWTEATSLDADASRAAIADDGGWKKHQRPLGTSYRDPSLSRRIDTAATGWDFDDSRSSIDPEPELERSAGLRGATGPPKQRGAGGIRRTARSMYEPPAAKGYSRW
jgi:hypothetical protein